MSDAERQSPRTAIHKWLQLTNSKSTTKLALSPPRQQIVKSGSRHYSRRHHTTRYPSESEGQCDGEAGRTHQRHSKSGTRQKRVSDKALLVDSLQAHTQEKLLDTSAKSNGLALAERLGLHAPFRNFKDYSDDDISKVQHRPRKRRRSRSSTSSYLEPAAANDLSENDNDRPSHAMTRCTANMRPAFVKGGDKKLRGASQGSEMMIQSPEKLLNSYERRPRHKTRPDRYELKSSNKDSKQAKQTARKDRGENRSKKHKRKEKSGAALMHDFAAQNVAHDRLTLKPATTLGLFGKGRASSPVRRNGLPDLAFSEMTFLKSRREKPKDSFENSSNRRLDKKKLRKSTIAADTEAEFSRYFMSAKPTSVDMTASDRQRYQQDKERSQDHESPHVSVDLPERPFLGFGSCGPNVSISPAKSAVNRDSRSLRRGVSRSSTRSTSYLSWSESRGPSCASPPPDRRHQVEPLRSSKLSNRKRTSPASQNAQRSIPPVSPPRVQTKSLGTRGPASRPFSKHSNANEAPSQNKQSRLATDERLRSREKSQNRIDTGTIELNAAKMPQDIEGSNVDQTCPTEATAHNSPDMVPPTRNRIACQSAGHEPRCEPPALGLRPLSAQTPLRSPHKDQLDDILEVLLKDCNSKVAGSEQASRGILSHCNDRVSNQTRIPARIQEESRMPARAFVNSICVPEAPASQSNSTRKPRDSIPQLRSAIDDSMSTHTLSRGSLKLSDRSSSGYTRGLPQTAAQFQADSKNAWNGYDTIYERQQEQSNLTPKMSTAHLAPCSAVRDGFLGPSGETDHDARPSDNVSGRYSVGAQDGYNDYMPDLDKTLQEVNNNDNNRDTRHGERCGKQVDYEVSSGSGTSMLDMFHEGLDDGFMAMPNDQERERSFSQEAGEPEIEHRLFTTNMSDIYSSWRPRHILGSNYSLQGYGADARVQDVDSAFSEFWSPHKLY